LSYLERKGHKAPKFNKFQTNNLKSSNTVSTRDAPVLAGSTALPKKNHSKSINTSSTIDDTVVAAEIISTISENS
jgi:hypothetical protein